MAATKLRIYQDAARMLADAALALITDTVETRYQLDNAWAGAVAFVLRQAAWRFALKTEALVAAGTPLDGYSDSYEYPADWLRTHGIFDVDTDGREHPSDLREQETTISANNASLWMRFVSSDYADPELASHPWPEHFAQAVAAYLAFSVAERVTGERGAANRMSQLFNQLLGEAVRLDAVPEDRWLPYQRTGEMLLGARDLLRRGNWRFAIIDVDIDTGTYPGGTGIGGFTNSFIIPDGHLRTVKLFLESAVVPECPFDIREQAGSWGTNADAFKARYVTWELGVHSERWEEPFRSALLSYLDAGRPQEAPQGQEKQPEWMRLLALALEASALPEDVWLQHQLTGRFQRAAQEVLSRGDWRFAIKTAAAVSGGTPAPGYAYSFAHPADRLRTQALYVATAGSEAPIDAREQDTHWSANVAACTVRYVSSDGLDARLWPEPFAKSVLAYLRMETAAPQEAQAAAAAFAAISGDALKTYGLPPDPWLVYQLNGDLLRGALDLLRRADWRFALKDATITATSGTPAAPFLRSYAKPADWLRTGKLFRSPSVGTIERPFDIREIAGYWSTDATAFTARYVSRTLGTDTTLWPEPFAAALLSYLDAGLPRDDAEANPQVQRWQQAMARAVADTAEPPDPWLPHQMSGLFERGKRAVLEQGYWVYRDPDGVMRGLHEVQYSYLDDQVVTQPGFAFPYRYPLPSDWFRTHALFIPWDGEEQPINVSETGHDWSTDAESFVARYVSDEVLDPATWPEAIDNAVLSWLDWQSAPPDQVKLRAEEHAAAMAAALRAYSRPENDWLRFELDGSFRAALKELLEKGRWRFAVRTVDLAENTDPLPSELAEGTVSPSYAYRFISPSDNIRTLRVYYLRGAAPYADRLDVDYRDEQAAIHANYTPVTIRYVSRLGMDPTKWPAHFRDALLAWLQYREARGDPAKAAIARAKMEAYETACREAERLDDARDMPQVLGSRFTAARLGHRSSRAREHGWYLP